MKRLLAVCAAVLLLLAYGTAFADESMGGAMGTQDKMITNDDLQKIDPNQDNSTLNQMPGGQAEGSSPGGVSTDTDTLKKEDGLEQQPVDKTPGEPGRSEPEGDRPATDLDVPKY